MLYNIPDHSRDLSYIVMNEKYTFAIQQYFLKCLLHTFQLLRLYIDSDHLDRLLQFLVNHLTTCPQETNHNLAWVQRWFCAKKGSILWSKPMFGKFESVTQDPLLVTDKHLIEYGCGTVARKQR